MKTMKLKNFQGNLIEYKEAKDTDETGGCDSCALRNKSECSMAIDEAVEAFGGGCADRSVHYEVAQ